MRLYLIIRRKQRCALNIFILYLLTQKVALLSRLASRCINRPFILFSRLCLKFSSSITCFLGITGSVCHASSHWRGLVGAGVVVSAIQWDCCQGVWLWLLGFKNTFLCFYSIDLSTNRGGSACSKTPFHCYI